MRKDELYSMDLSEFLEQVDGCLSWEEEKLLLDKKLLENQLDWLSWFSANIMISGGNLGKRADPIKIKEGLYTTEEQITERERKEDAKTAKEKLVKRFNLDV